MNRAFILAALAALLLTGCAAEVNRQASVLSMVTAPGPSFTTGQTTTVPTALGYQSIIPQGIELVEIGTIPEGRVLKPAKWTLMVEGAHIHEAYVVVQGARLVGFYLPVEKAFSPLSESLPFPLQPRKT